SREIFLSREVGIEEVIPRHGEEPRDPIRHGADGIGHRRRITVLIQLGIVEGTEDSVLMSSQRELELDLDSGTRLRSPPSDGFPAASCRRHAVQGPRNRFEKGCLPGPVRADNTDQPWTEIEIGAFVLPEVAEAEPMNQHQAGAMSGS